MISFMVVGGVGERPGAIRRNDWWHMLFLLKNLYSQLPACPSLPTTGYKHGDHTVCPSFLLRCYEKTQNKTSIGEQGWKPSRKLEATGEMVVNGLALWSLFSLLCYVTQAHLLRDNTTHSGLGPCTSIVTEEYSAQECSLANLQNPIPQLKFLFLGYLCWCQGDKN